MTRFAVALAALFLALAAPAVAQVESREGIALQNQILELRRDLESLRAGGGGGGAARLPPPVVSGGGGVAPGLSGDMVARMQALEETVRDMRGRLDEAQNSNRQLRADVEKLRGDLEFRLDALEKGGATARPATPAPTGTLPARPGQQTASAPAAGAEGFTAAQAALRANQYAEAERGFKDFVARNRSDPRVPEAYLGIGRALQGRREWAQAALAYDDSYKRFPRGTFAQESLLGLGQSMHGLGDKSAACEAYARLSSEFSTTMKPGVRTALGAARQQSNCR